MAFNNPVAFAVFAVLWIGGGNLLAWHFGFHVQGPFGYCQGYGCR